MFALGQLTFEKPDMTAFPGLALAYRAAETGGSMPVVYNAANEKAVELFLERRISYPGIAELIQEAMEGHRIIAKPTVEEILAAEQETHQRIREKVSRAPGIIL